MLRAVLFVALVPLLALSGFLIWVALDQGPYQKLTYDPSVLSAPEDIPSEDKLDINALCEAGNNGQPTTVEISENYRNPIIKVILALFANESGPWKQTEVAMLESQLADFLSDHELADDGMLVIARSGLSTLQRLRVINDHGADMATVLDSCNPGSTKRAKGEAITECIARNWGGNRSPFTYTHTGFLVRHNGRLRVLHTYPLDQHLTFFCEPLSVFLGLPLDERSLLVMAPPISEQKRLRSALEDNLGVQLAEMRYSMTSPHDAPNYSQSNGPAFHGILATTLDRKYDLRDSVNVVDNSGYTPAVVLVGRPFVARIADFFVPVIDLTTQPYAKQGLFFSVTPGTLVNFVRKRGWRIAKIGLESWAMQEEKPSPE